MTTALSSPARTGRRSPAIVAAVAGAVILATTACPGNVHHTYKTFHSAVERGATCAELFEQRTRFSSEDTLADVDADLARIGCTSPSATRTDR